MPAKWPRTSLFTHGSKLPSFNGGLKWGKKNRRNPVEVGEWPMLKLQFCRNIGIPWNVWNCGAISPKSCRFVFNRNIAKGQIHHRRSAQGKPGWYAKDRPRCSKCIHYTQAAGLGVVGLHRALNSLHWRCPWNLSNSLAKICRVHCS